MDKKFFDVKYKVPGVLNLIGQYDINGRILILPIQGKGPCNFTFGKMFPFLKELYFGFIYYPH